jgi:serine/threonine protein kinase
VGTLREIVYLKSLPPHENLIRILAVEWDERQIRVGMPRYSTDLHSYMKEWQRRKMNIPAREARLYSHQILLALDHIHRHGVFSRDVKPQNILLDGLGNAVLCDFSLASSFASKISHSLTVQTLWYRAPEILFGASKYDASIDMWSYGCVVGFFIRGEDILPGKGSFQDEAPTSPYGAPFL